ncbi:hypothetical protein JOC55_003315 [Paenibacillus sacheonensis]|nr:hypothetical protein [Paenibacillus sacheonensis]
MNNSDIACGGQALCTIAYPYIRIYDWRPLRSTKAELPARRLITNRERDTYPRLLWSFYIFMQMVLHFKNKSDREVVFKDV